MPDPPLPLASAECVRKAAHVLRAAPDPAQEVRHALLALARLLHAVDQEWLATRSSRVIARVERGERILEDHLHLAPERPQAPTRAAARARPPSHWPAAMKISPPVGSMALRMPSRRGGLAQPLSPTSPRVSPSSMLKVDAVDRAERGPPSAQEALAEPERASASPATRSSGVLRRSIRRENSWRLPVADRPRIRRLPTHVSRYEIRTARMEGAARRAVVWCGTAPAIASGRGSRALPRAHAGMERRSRPRVRVLSARGRSRRPAPARRTRPRIHDRDVRRHLGDHAQVVRDEHDRHPVFLAGAGASARGSVSAWSRRARWWARPRSTA